MSGTGAVAADSNFLTIDQAVANLDAAEKRDETPAGAVEPAEPNTEAEPAAQVASEPETATDGETAETEDAEGEGEQPELPAIEPPRFWDAGAKDRFRELPRDLQELVLAKETERDKATAQAIESAALKRKAAEAEASKFASTNSVLDKLLPEAKETFKSRWENVDWDRVIQERGAEEALILQNQMNRERSIVQQLEVAKSEAEQAQTKQFVADRFEKLKTIVPDFADDKEGPARQLETVNFLSGLGINPKTVIERASAEELSVAYDAMRWRKAQADAKAKTSAPATQPRTATPPKPTVRPTATPARAGSPQQARIQSLQKKAHLTVEEAVELMDLQET